MLFSMKKILIILGTRPEAIKLAPLILELRKYPDLYDVTVCNTEQQKELSSQALGYFGIQADLMLDTMRPSQSLIGLQARMMEALAGVFESSEYDAVFVQGDTMSVLCGALAGFYHRVPVFHVEAGLRSYDLGEPFPEEAVRRMVASVASCHFAPTQSNEKALLAEGIGQEMIKVTGNTAIDALFCLPEEVLSLAAKDLSEKGVDLGKQAVLVTMHRRENLGERLGNVLEAIICLSKEYPAHQFVWPVHPNPAVCDPVYKALGLLPNVVLLAPLEYPEIVCLMKESCMVLTDSGGIQEEAPSFGVPVLVLREKTERMEAVHEGASYLVGTHTDRILQYARKCLDGLVEMGDSRRKNPYGDSHACERIVCATGNFLGLHQLELSSYIN